MKKINIYILGFILSSATFISCQQEREIRYTGASVVEFKNHILGRNAAYTPEGVFLNATGTAMTLVSRHVSVNNRGRDSILVQLVGHQSSTDIHINYAIGALEVPLAQQNIIMPAVEGTHYEFVNPERVVTIPANSSSAWILIDPIPGSTVAGNQYYLVLQLLGNDQVLPSQNYSTFTTYYRN
ncbi:hypothetical protein M8998_15350 [Sphingobacterium sp. lm-10]|uniref:hypothetical protein n=1 Tax=Sphingobacterium sp. lm-10 TaxID=2944904 RepID=UPI00201FC46A|nr:hypothetical protein [Sphingobacterium sp. lm-10]MCL7989326.1 hypothetical protein [Sphingobacterium sp. lm-10]